MDRQGFRRWIVLVVVAFVLTIAAVLLVGFVLQQDWGGWIALAFGVFCGISGLVLLPKRDGGD